MRPGATPSLPILVRVFHLKHNLNVYIQSTFSDTIIF